MYKKIHKVTPIFMPREDLQKLEKCRKNEKEGNLYESFCIFIRRINTAL